jgi:hypothetical protein
MSFAMASLRTARKALALGALLALLPAAALAAYPPHFAPPINQPVFSGKTGVLGGPIFTNVHNYGNIIIKVDVYNNYFGDFTKYWWVYTVTNNTYDPSPPQSNGFSGFELALPAAVPDIGNIVAPDGIPPWQINTYSGAPVEWDLTDTNGAPVAGGTLPGQTEVYSFTTAPRLITLSTGWFHTWIGDVQSDIIDYPAGDAPEVPDVLSQPNQELCCSKDPATGGYICQTLPAGQCSTIGGMVVPACSDCPPIVPTQRGTWGKVKAVYHN